MKILLTNDDGIEAAGMRCLVRLVAELGHEVFIVAPKTNRSGVGQAITLGRTIEIKRSDFHDDYDFVKEAWSVDGNPADAVKYALGNRIVMPDLILSGINSGPNLGRNIFYSGTVGAAMEGVFHNITSVALSVFNWQHPRWEPAIHYGRLIVRKIIDMVQNGADELPAFLLNVNFPDVDINDVKGIRLTKQGCSGFVEKFHPCKEGMEDMFYLDGEMTEPDTDEYTDLISVKNGYVSASTFVPDVNSHSVFKTLHERELFHNL